MKTRKQKAEEYESKYSHIPRDYYERLQWMYETMNLSDKTVHEIFSKRDAMLASLFYNEFFIVLYEEPEGAPRPRTRLINRRNISNAAMSNGSFIQVYSIISCYVLHWRLHMMHFSKLLLVSIELIQS